MQKSPVYIGLVHYPVYNKRMEIITTAITNMDLHDIARTAKTYQVQKFFLIHPQEAQKKLVGEIIRYWQQGFGATYNPDRQTALQLLEIRDSIDDAIRAVQEECQMKPVVVTTDARVFPNTITYRALRSQINHQVQPYLILFGTGWGIERETMGQFDYILEPIQAKGDYNHLSVRSAAAIILDRLLGETWWLTE